MSLSKEGVPSFYADLHELAEVLNLDVGTALQEYSWSDADENTGRLDDSNNKTAYNIDEVEIDDSGIVENFWEENMEDISERLKIEHFKSDSCGCSLGRDCEPCSSDLNVEYITNCRSDALQLEKGQLDMLIMMAIRMSIRNCTVTTKELKSVGDSVGTPHIT